MSVPGHPKMDKEAISIDVNVYVYVIKRYLICAKF